MGAPSSQQATAEGDGAEREPRPAHRHARQHVGQPVHTEEDPRPGDGDGDQRGDAGDGGLDAA